MKAYWYAKGQAGEYEIKQLYDLVGFFSPIPHNAQVWILDDGSPSSQDEKWFHINARSRIVPVHREACNELRAALLLQGVSCP